VWDWPTKAGVDPTYPKGKQEIYTTCMDVDIVQAVNNKLGVSSIYETDQDLNNAAIPSQFDALGKAVSSQQSSGVTSMPTAARETVTEWITVKTTQTVFGSPTGY
jgi:hypothetical protein